MAFIPRPIANSFHKFAKSKNEYSRLLKIAMPLSVGYLGHMAIGTTDVIMIGKLGPVSLAASTISISIYYTVYLFFMGIVVAITPIASQALGARKARTARRAVRQGMWVAVTLSIPGYFMLWHIENFYVFTEQAEELIKPASLYMRYFMWALLPGLLLDALRSFMISLGRPQPIFLISLVGVIVNIILNYALIFGNLGAPALGLMGAGISSSIVTSLMFLTCAVFILKSLPYRRYHVFSRIWRPDWEIYRHIYKLGLPIGGTLMLEQTMYAAATLMAGRLGTVEAAAQAVAMTMVNIVYVISMGLSEATTSRVGYNYGKKDYVTLKKFAWAGLSLSTIVMITLAFLIVLFRGSISEIFLDGDTEQARHVLSIAAFLIVIGMVFEVFDAIQLSLRGSLYGMSDMRVSFYTSLISYTGFGLGIAYYLSTYTNLGIIGIWYGMTVGIMLTTVILALRFKYITGRLPTNAA